MVKHGVAPFLECSSQGDARFSALFARINGRENKTIEEIYQGAKVFEDGQTGMYWRLAKGKKPVNVEEVRQLYSQLWDEYIEENPELKDILLHSTGLSDQFGQPGHACQATELWRIKQRLHLRQTFSWSQSSSRDWTEDAKYENGNYLCMCCKCNLPFIGYKRRVVCKECSNG